MGDGEKAPLRLQFNPKVRLEFHGSTITSDAGLLAFREFDDALGLTEIAEDYLQESRTGRNILHHLVPLLRQSIYSRLAGYDDTNDAVRLSQDPAMRVIVGWQGSERKGASTSEMGRFETEFLTQEDNLKGLARINTQWVERAMAHTLHRRVILDMDSSDLDGLALEKSSSPPIRVSARLLPLLDEVGGLVALYVFNRPFNRLTGPDVMSSGWGQDSQEDAELRRCIAVAKGFSRKMAHDFNNHIAVMQGFASILQNRLKEDEQNRGLAEQIELSGAEALKLTNRLSIFSIDFPAEPVSLDLNQLVQEAIETGRVDQPGEIDLN